MKIRRMETTHKMATMFMTAMRSSSMDGSILAYAANLIPYLVLVIKKPWRDGYFDFVDKVADKLYLLEDKMMKDNIFRRWSLLL